VPGVEQREQCHDAALAVIVGAQELSARTSFFWLRKSARKWRRKKLGSVEQATAVNRSKASNELLR
jgi:hypothetical protein